MKATELKPGDVLDGWTVTSVEITVGMLDDVTLLELEDKSFEVVGQNGEVLSRLERRTWLRADEEVEVSRD